MKLSGSFVALITPFTEKGCLDLEALSQLIEWHIEEGTKGIVLAGTTGEAPTLTVEEKDLLFEVGVRAARGRIPIIAGVGSYDTRSSLCALEKAQKIGVDGALIIVPYYNRPTPHGCLLHYQTLSDVGLPLIVYHHPGRTGLKLSSETLSAIADLPFVVGIKECSPDMGEVVSLLQKVRKPVMAGDDPLLLPFMGAGASGIISVIANLIPRPWQELTELLATNQYDLARACFKTYYPLCRALGLETNPQPVKYALSLLKKCRPVFRLPLLAPEPHVQEAIETALNLCCPLQTVS